jgi:hypothetical protein
MKKKKVGGLCAYLGRKYHWSKVKTNKCIAKAARGRGRKRKH